jgi:hypothetical protein
MDFIINKSTMLILSTMDYMKMFLSGKLNIAFIIITMLEISLKKITYIEIVSNFYTY